MTQDVSLEGVAVHNIFLPNGRRLLFPDAAGMDLLFDVVRPHARTALAFLAAVVVSILSSVVVIEFGAFVWRQVLRVGKLLLYVILFGVLFGMVYDTLSRDEETLDEWLDYVAVHAYAALAHAGDKFSALRQYACQHPPTIFLPFPRMLCPRNVRQQQRHTSL